MSLSSCEKCWDPPDSMCDVKGCPHSQRQKIINQIEAPLLERIMKLEDALINSRASFLGLQPFLVMQPNLGGPIAAQVGLAIERINRALMKDDSTP